MLTPWTGFSQRNYCKSTRWNQCVVPVWLSEANQIAISHDHGTSKATDSESYQHAIRDNWKDHEISRLRRSFISWRIWQWGGKETRTARTDFPWRIFEKDRGAWGWSRAIEITQPRPIDLNWTAKPHQYGSTEIECATESLNWATENLNWATENLKWVTENLNWEAWIAPGKPKDHELPNQKAYQPVKQMSAIRNHNQAMSMTIKKSELRVYAIQGKSNPLTKFAKLSRFVLKTEVGQHDDYSVKRNS